MFALLPTFRSGKHAGSVPVCLSLPGPGDDDRRQNAPGPGFRGGAAPSRGGRPPGAAAPTAWRSSRPAAAPRRGSAGWSRSSHALIYPRPSEGQRGSGRLRGPIAGVPGGVQQHPISIRSRLTLGSCVIATPIELGRETKESLVSWLWRFRFRVLPQTLAWRDHARIAFRWCVINWHLKHVLRR